MAENFLISGLKKRLRLVPDSSITYTTWPDTAFPFMFYVFDRT